MANTGIRRLARANMIPLWKIANMLCISEMTLIRWLRVELSEEKRQRIMDAITQLKQEGA